MVKSLNTPKYAQIIDNIRKKFQKTIKNCKNGKKFVYAQTIGNIRKKLQKIMKNCFKKLPKILINLYKLYSTFEKNLTKLSNIAQNGHKFS